MDLTLNRALYSLLLPYFVSSSSCSFSGVFILVFKNLPSYPHTFKFHKLQHQIQSHHLPSSHSRIHPSTESITPSCHISCCQLHLPDFNMVPWEHRPILLVSIAPHCLRGSRCSIKERRLMACSYSPHWSSHSAKSSGDLVRSRCYRNHKTHFNILDQWADWQVNCLPACPLLWLQRPF